MNKNIQLYQGDCLDLFQNINNYSIDMVITSPPYDNLRTYNGTCEWNFDIFKKIAKEIYRVLKKGGICVWVVADMVNKGSETGTSFRQALYFKEIGFNIHDTMIYAKNNYIPKTHNRYEQAFEYIFVFTKGKPKTFNPIMIECKTFGSKKYRGNAKDDSLFCSERKRDVRTVTKQYKIAPNIFYYNVGTNYKTKHPAVFPLNLAKDQIKSWTNEGDIILDPFIGSGTTAISCYDLNRKCIGFEKCYEYFLECQNILNNHINKN